MAKLEWNVYRYNINKQNFELFNIFEHYTFFKYINKILKKYKNENEEKFEEFSEEVNKEVMYYFWAKSEYEVIIKEENGKIFMEPWIGKDGLRLELNTESYNWNGLYKKMTDKFIHKDGVKIDIYEQVMFKKEEFMKYLWSLRKNNIRRHNYDL